MFKKFQGLKEETRLALLNEVLEGSRTPESAGKQAIKAKKISVLKATFVNVTGLQTRSDVKEKYPDATTDESLAPFIASFPVGKLVIRFSNYLHNPQ
jgi:hypothetical protein